MKKGKTLLTASIVVVIAAIYVVGFFLLWDYLNSSGKLNELFNTDILGNGDPVPSIEIDSEFTGTVVSEEEEKLIYNYFGFYYAAIGTLKTADLSDWFTFQSCDELFDKLALDYEIALAGERTFDSCKLTMNVRRRAASEKKKTVEIRLLLSAEYQPVGLNAPCKVSGEAHTFIIDTSEKKLKIKSHTTDRAARAASDFALDELLAEHKYTRADLAYTYFPTYIKTCYERLCGKIVPIAEMGSLTPVIYADAEYEFDRDTAVSAAISGFELRRTSTVYEENDTNFTSWCIFEAGVPMDAQGSGAEQWKWYSEDINHERKKVGCTESWYDREAFYEYVGRNTGFGLVAYEAPPSHGERGDIIQIMRGDKPALQCMITDILTEDGVITDFIVCTDVYGQVPLRAIAGAEFRLLHIVGYNTANI